MAYSTKLTTFAQSIYLVIKNRYFDDIAGADGQDFIAQVIDWTNQYLDEFETVVDPLGRPVSWNCMRSNDSNLGTAVAGDTQVDLPTGFLNLIATPKRPVTITSPGGVVISRWRVVRPDQFDTTVPVNYVTQVADALYFNRPLNAQEDGGTIAGDATFSLDRVTAGTTTALDVIKPKQLLILGVAKNSSLPDIVQGGLSPSFVQKYNDLLSSAILFNSASSTADTVDRDDFSFVGGVGF